jgi:hypothetical protein
MDSIQGSFVKVAVDYALEMAASAKARLTFHWTLPYILDVRQTPSGVIMVHFQQRVQIMCGKMVSPCFLIE